jgi:hypothetical protein
VRPNLTLNLGIRYEAASVFTERKKRLSNLPTPTSAQPRLGSPFIQNPTLHDIEPRVGFAWNPWRNGKTVIRGGFGLYDVCRLLTCSI